MGRSPVDGTRWRNRDAAAWDCHLRPWALATFGAATNRCTVCMGYVLRLTPSGADATAADMPGMSASIAKAPPLDGLPAGPLDKKLFIRAAELLPRVRSAFGVPDVEGAGRLIWPRVVGIKGVLFIENCYETDGDKKINKYSPVDRVSGDHWDLFDGLTMLTLEEMFRNNNYPGNVCFWKTRT
jgi:hypothetical protein